MLFVSLTIGLGDRVSQQSDYSISKNYIYQNAHTAVHQEINVLANIKSRF
ncbi:MAG: hypothetical protein HC847_20065 [Hydrococcus sp. RU_2_2]|nr:hypothetical protein [Hydrococcus sp. RU_2_2]